MKPERALGEVLISMTIAAIMPANMPKTVVILASEDEDGHIFRDLKADIFLVRSADEFEEFGRKHGRHVLVTSSGLDLARELLETGALQTCGRMFWNLRMPFTDTFRVLESLQLPETLTVCGFFGTSGEMVLETTVEVPEKTVELSSFLAGVKVAVTPSCIHDRLDFELEEHGDDIEKELTELRNKYLSLLLALEYSTANRNEIPPVGMLASNERTMLEDKLIQLNRRHSSLERQYKALSKSRLGKITLTVWKIKRRGLGTVFPSRKTKA